jgi:phage terminase small subunit
MKKGGRSKPTKLKLLEGNPGKRPLPQDEPMPEPIEPTGARLTLSEAEILIWDDLFEILEPLGLVTEADGENFANICRLISKIRQIDLVLQDPETKMLISWTESTPSGTEKPVVKLNPLMAEHRQLMKDLRLYAAEFGMTPRGRVGLSVGGTGEKKSKMEGMLD